MEIRTITWAEEEALRLEMRRGVEEIETPQLDAYRKKVASDYHKKTRKK